MKSTIFLPMVPLLLLSINCQAAIGEVEGETTCTIIKSLSNKVAREVSCSYKGLVESSMKHTLSHVRYRLKTGEIFETVDDATFDIGKLGDMVVLTSPASINGLPAKPINIGIESYEVVPELEMRERRKIDNPLFPDVLYCFKLIQHDEAFCVPYDITELIS